MNNDEKILKALETLQTDVKAVKQGQAQTNERLSRLEDGQAHLETATEAIKTGQEELQKTAAREVTVMKVAERLTRKVNDHEERITDLEKIEGIPHPHKH